jgi:hypothetical protein
MLHQDWIGSFVQGLIMGAGMAVAMMVPAGLRVMARWARWGGRRRPRASLRGGGTGARLASSQPPTKQSGRPFVTPANAGVQHAMRAWRTERCGHRSHRPVSATATAETQRHGERRELGHILGSPISPTSINKFLVVLPVRSGHWLRADTSAFSLRPPRLCVGSSWPPSTPLLPLPGLGRPILKSAPAPMGYVVCLIARVVGDCDERGREAFINEELHL